MLKDYMSIAAKSQNGVRRGVMLALRGWTQSYVASTCVDLLLFEPSASSVFHFDTDTWRAEAVSAAGSW